MDLSRAAARRSAGAACAAATLLVAAPAAAAEPTYPPPAFGGGGTTVSTTVDVPAVQPAPARLPSTGGGDVRLLLAAGALGVALGGATLLVARRRAG